MSDENTLVFQGRDGKECEAFIRAVKSRAFSTGKQRDYEWMADFASTCFEGDGLRWFCGLDDETQGNWKLLERALLRDFPSVTNAAAPPPSSIPTAPAAAPPPPPFASGPPPSFNSQAPAPAQLPWYLPTPPTAPGVAPRPTFLRKGRLRLVFDGETATHSAYIKNMPNSYGFCTTTSSLDDALCVEYQPSEGRVELVVFGYDDPTRREVFGAQRVVDRRLQRANLVMAPNLASGDSKIWLAKPGPTISFLPRLEHADGAVLRVYKRDHRPVIVWGTPGTDTSPARLEFEPLA